MLATLIDFPNPHDPAAARMRWRFGEPLRVWQAFAPDEVHGVLQAVEQAARAGRWCVGGLAYEAATAFDPAFSTHIPKSGLPLAWFAEFEAPVSTDAVDAVDANEQLAHIHWKPGPHSEQARHAFEADIARIHAAIARFAAQSVTP